VIAPPPPPALVDPGTAFGSLAARVGARTDALVVLVDGRRRLRIRPAPGPRRVALPVPVGEHDVQVEARGPGGARRSREVRVAVLPASGRRLGRLPGWVDPRLQSDVEHLAAGLPAISGVYVEHLVSGCGAAINADAQFPGASTLKAAILLEAVRRAGGRPPADLAGLLDEMVELSDDRAANDVLARVGGGPAVTATLAAMGLGRSLVRRPYILDDARRPLVPDATVQPELRTNFITTPYELARLMVAIQRGALGRGVLPRLGVSSAAIRTQVIPRLLAVRDTTKLAAGLPPGTPLVHKTGYTKEVKHDAGIAYLRSGPVVAAVMTWSAAGVSDASGDRFIADVARAAARRLADGGRCSP
jgi:beta-lactamase class A